MKESGWDMRVWNQYGTERKPAICWDCAKACGGCSWSKKLEPVPGWTAEPRKITIQKDQQLDTYLVTACPEFQRDARNNGMVRVRAEGVRKHG